MNLAMLNAALPKAPFDLQEEVELYARESGRTARLHYFPGAGWFARFNLRCNDPAMLLFQQGMTDEPPGEDVFFMVPDPSPTARPGDMVPLDVLQMGRAGVREFLERGNTWSGRGEYDSIVDAHAKAREANRQAKMAFKAQRKDENRQRQRAQRRWWLKIPLVAVGIDVGRRIANRGRTT